MLPDGVARQRVNIDRVLGVEEDKFNTGGVYGTNQVAFLKTIVSQLWTLSSPGHTKCVAYFKELAVTKLGYLFYLFIFIYLYFLGKLRFEDQNISK